MPGIELPIEDIRRAAADPAFCAAMDALYVELDAEIAQRRPVCLNRGVCCDFERYGHRLYVTAVELAYFIASAGGPLRAGGPAGDCPYHKSGVCVARAGRPAGCRIFFCDPDAQDWQGPLTERILVRLQEVGSRFGVPYAYVEWRSSLRALYERGDSSVGPSC
jgi:hypothetical protein